MFLSIFNLWLCFMYNSISITAFFFCILEIRTIVFIFQKGWLSSQSKDNPQSKVDFCLLFILNISSFPFSKIDSFDLFIPLTSREESYDSSSSKFLFPFVYSSTKDKSDESLNYFKFKKVVKKLRRRLHSKRELIFFFLFKFYGFIIYFFNFFNQLKNWYNLTNSYFEKFASINNILKLYNSTFPFLCGLIQYVAKFLFT